MILKKKLAATDTSVVNTTTEKTTPTYPTVSDEDKTLVLSALRKNDLLFEHHMRLISHQGLQIALSTEVQGIGTKKLRQLQREGFIPNQTRSLSIPELMASTYLTSYCNRKQIQFNARDIIYATLVILFEQRVAELQS